MTPNPFREAAAIRFAAAAARRHAIARDDEGHALREIAFVRWKIANASEAAAVPLWLAVIGEVNR